MHLSILKVFRRMSRIANNQIREFFSDNLNRDTILLQMDAISARSYLKGVGEWNLPPVRFSDVGTASFFLSSVRPAIFAGVLAADPGASFAHTYESVGFQLDWNFTIAVRLPMTFSIGYARGFSDSSITTRHDEILASLKIL